MDKPMFSWNSLAKTAVFALLIALLFSFYQFFDRQTKVVFCDVGQGDSAYIRIDNKIDILIDAGPDRKVLDCLGKHMPFYDRKIEYVFISHPQKDHYGGLLYVLDRYQVGKILMNRLDSPGSSFHTLIEKINQKHVQLVFPEKSQSLKILNSQIKFYWPTKEFLAKNLIYERPNNILGISSLDDNDFSLIFTYEENNRRILFTGDASILAFQSVIKEIYQAKLPIYILKIPHHGSKNGLNQQLLQLANPTLSVISVGKNNSYGHPSKEVLNLLKGLNKKYFRTDEKGDITFKLP